VADPNASILGLSVSELDHDDVDRLLREGETRVVERKSNIPRDVLGPAVCSLANTLGGWLLIGVTDDDPPKVVGFAPPGGGRTHLQDYIRDRLRGEVDPIPPFAAIEWKMPDGPIGIVRVYESTDTPHMVRRTGAVYVREQGGKIPASHEMVRDLARQGNLARERADERLREKPFFDPETVRTLALPFQSSTKESKLYSLRATPLTVGPVFRDRALTESFTNYLVSDVLPLLRPAHDQLFAPVIQHFQHGIAVYEQSIHTFNNSAALGAVSVNNLGSVELHSVRTTAPDDARRLDLDAQEQMYFRPVLTAVAELLAALEAVGSCRYLLELETPEDSQVRQMQQAGMLPGRRVRFTGEFGVPAAAEEVQSHAADCRRQLARAGGLTAWEPQRR
jgi:Putative DNA-binding domain